MTCPICAWSLAELHYPFLFETELWRVVLAPNQSLLGRCVVQLKRHEGDLANQTEAELGEWLEVVGILETVLRSAFKATMFNWSCYMNHSYRAQPYEPHIHWWAVPRYDHPVSLGSQVFTDPHFGSPYDHGRYLTVPDEFSAEIIIRLKRFLDRA